jgi:hypothetical protein
MAAVQHFCAGPERNTGGANRSSDAAGRESTAKYASLGTCSMSNHPPNQAGTD